MLTHRAREIDVAERTGVLGPQNLVRFSAHWIAPGAGVSEVVDTYWTVRWELGAHETVTQRIIDHPAITLSIEQGDVRAPFLLSTVRSRAWMRTITGRGEVFAIRLRPAGLATLTDLDPTALPSEVELTSGLDERGHRLLVEIASDAAPQERARRADALIHELLDERPLTRDQRLANSAVDVLTATPRVRPGRAVAQQLHVSERTLQRALRTTIGRGPNEVARRIRMQEVVRRLSQPEPDIATTAMELGYTDQAHLTNEFRSVAGVTPGQYLSEQRGS